MGLIMHGWNLYGNLPKQPIIRECNNSRELFNLFSNKYPSIRARVIGRSNPDVVIKLWVGENKTKDHTFSLSQVINNNEYFSLIEKLEIKDII